MSSFKIISLFMFLLATSACGFRPLYTPPSEDSTSQEIYAFDEMQRVVIANLPEREGQYLRNALVRLIHPKGRQGEAHFILNVSLSESTNNLAVQRSSEATRANLIVKGDIQLRRVVGGKVFHSYLVTSSSGFNIYRSEFQTLMAEKGARERALGDLAQQIRIRLATYLTNANPSDLRP